MVPFSCHVSCKSAVFFVNHTSAVVSAAGIVMAKDYTAKSPPLREACGETNF